MSKIISKIIARNVHITIVSAKKIKEDEELNLNAKKLRTICRSIKLVYEFKQHISFKKIIVTNKLINYQSICTPPTRPVLL